MTVDHLSFMVSEILIGKQVAASKPGDSGCLLSESSSPNNTFSGQAMAAVWTRSPFEASPVADVIACLSYSSASMK
jgi:hypothetical protein